MVKRRRLIVVYNPRSSHYRLVRRDVLSKTTKLEGWMVGKFEVADTDVDDNATRLAKVLNDDDLVVAAGGDGTANIAINGIMLSKAKNVRVGVLGYGNFNDTARSFGMMKFEQILKGDAREVWPLELSINGNHWRYGMCYFTLGMFAEACGVFDHPKTRKALQSGRKRLVFSLGVLARWWMKQRKKHAMPDYVLGNSSEEYLEVKKTSDYMAVNGRTVAKMMKGGKYYLQNDTFLSYSGLMTRFFRLCSMMLRSIFHRIPGTESDYDQLVFKKPAKIMFQAEGEYKKIDGVELVEVRKASKPLLAVMK